MEAVRRRALGRGLGALIPSGPSSEEPTGDTRIALSAIQPNPMQPRQAFADEGIEELAESIRQKGILQPLLVRRIHGGFQLIAGERRYRAAQRLGLEHVPASVREATDNEMLEMALIENVQRENLNPMEEARAYRRLIDEFSLTQDDVAARVGKDRSTVANALRLLQLPIEVQLDIERGVLSAGHARALLAAGPHSEKMQLAREVVSKRLSVRETERLAKRKTRPLADADQRAAEQRLTEALGTRVRLLSRKGGAGRVEIEYYTLEQLNALVDRLSTLSAT